MSQTGYIAFLILAAFLVYLTARNELGTYVSFFTTSGQDATAPVVGQKPGGSGGTVKTAEQLAPYAAAILSG